MAVAVAAAVVVVAAVAVAVAGPARGAPAPPPPVTTTAAPPTTTTGSTAGATAGAPPGGSTTTTAPPPPGGTGVAQADSEVPADEAELLGLIDGVHARLVSLQAQIAGLDAELAANQVTYGADAAALARAQAAVYAADRKVDSVEVEQAAARQAIRAQAVQDYMNPPADALANLLVNIRRPAQILDARGFYQALVEVQVRRLRAFDRLGRTARATAAAAQQASDAALGQQQKVAAVTAVLESLKKALEAVQRASTDQQATQTQLLTEVGLDRARFAAEVAAEAQQSANIDRLLASLSIPGAPAVAPTAGFFVIPVPGAPITSPYGPRTDPIAGYAGFHPGVDFGAPSGTPIDAAGAGVVVFAGEETGYGNFTCINHGDNIATCYGHQSAILVTVGQPVGRGQEIGLVGQTGYATGPHLHFEVRVDGKVTDPMPWLTGVATPG